MPSAPKLGNSFGRIRIIKVFIKMEAEHASKPYGHVTISGKIKIDLQCVCNTSDPRNQPGILPRSIHPDSICNDSKTVCQDRFLGKSDNKTLNATAEIFQSGSPVFYFKRNVFITNDRTGDELREQYNK